MNTFANVPAKRSSIKDAVVLVLTVTGFILNGACGSPVPSDPTPVASNPATPPPPPPPTPPPTFPASPTWDVNLLGVPRFVDVDYIELSKIRQVTRFRSSAGHDYADDFERCRSMKHYYMPRDSASAISARIVAPVTGTVESLYVEWAGTQIRIRSEAYPAFLIVIFHVQLTAPLTAGQTVTAGQLLGTHIGNQTSSDVAVRVATPTGQMLVSWFDLLTDVPFQAYQARGVATRDVMIMSRAARDADPLTCAEGAFTSWGTSPQWVVLQ